MRNISSLSVALVLLVAPCDVHAQEVTYGHDVSTSELGWYAHCWADFGQVSGTQWMSCQVYLDGFGSQSCAEYEEAWALDCTTEGGSFSCPEGGSRLSSGASLQSSGYPPSGNSSWVGECEDDEEV